MKKITSFFQSKNITADKKRTLDEYQNCQDDEGTEAMATSKTQDQKVSRNAHAKRIQTAANLVTKNDCHVEEILSHLSNHGGWKEALRSEFQSASFRQLAHFIAKERASHTIFPSISDTWQALNATPLDKIRVCIVGQDPYHGENQAHGLCFSVIKGNTPPPSLKNIFKELAEDPAIDFPKHKIMPNHGNLQRWAEQGVLLLNNVLTVRQGKPCSHKSQGWEHVTDAILQATIHRSRKGCVFLLWGKPATEKTKHIAAGNRKSIIISTSHPSPLGARKTNAPFLGSRCFSRCNAALTSLGHTPIDWNVDN